VSNGYSAQKMFASWQTDNRSTKIGAAVRLDDHAPYLPM
jgi:hypothetical protein